MSTQRDEILGCACELFLKGGLDGFSMRRLARSVGVTAPALYRHYEGREDVLRSVVGEAYKIFYQYLYGSLRGNTPAERLEMAGEAYLEFAMDHPRYYEMIHAPIEVMGIEELPEEIATQARAIGRFWHDRLRECIDTGFIRAEDPEEIGITFWAHSHGLVSLFLRGMMGSMEREDFRSLYRESSRRTLRGIATDEGAKAVPPVGSEYDGMPKAGGPLKSGRGRSGSADGSAADGSAPDGSASEHGSTKNGAQPT